MRRERLFTDFTLPWQRQIYSERGQWLEKSCWLRGHQVTVWKAAPEEDVTLFY